jgi:Ca2+-binding EF-hand superfamily protein
MFSKLDEDGGGTLDCGEIQSLFVQNGIHMTVEEVASMFGEATRMDAGAKFRKLL